MKPSIFPEGALDYPSFGSSPIDQPKDPVEMSRQEEDDLFDATLERDDVADRIWDMIKDEITPDLHREIVRVLFRKHIGFAGVSRDFTEGGRLIHKDFSDRVEKIVDDESSNTDMGRDDD